MQGLYKISPTLFRPAIILALAVFLVAACVSDATTNTCTEQNCVEGIQPKKAGFLVVAPDRGYAGNQKARAAFKMLNEKYNAQLIFATDDRMRPYLKKSLNHLKSNGASKIIVLPLFLSASHPRLTLFRTMLQEEADGESITYARIFGGTYLAVEMLADRLQDSNIKNEPLIVAGFGATTEKSRVPMQRDIQRLVEQAVESAGKDNRVEAIILPGGEHDETRKARNKAAWSRMKNISAQQKSLQILPFHLGKELDGMMNFNAMLEYDKPGEMQIIRYKDNEVDFTSLWMLREANRYLSSSVGIIFHAHGSDFHWNQNMRDAVSRLARKTPVEFAFSMADPDDLRQAVKRLEQRGAGIIVIVRVFGMQTSFRHAIERLIGQDIDAPELCLTEEESAMTMKGPPAKRLRTTALVVTEGGLSDNPLFAKALYDRAKALSPNPAKATVILVAHGKGRDEANILWLKVLDSLAGQIDELSGGEFRAVKYQTWQEDWEDKRGDRINAVKQMVIDAQQDAGTAIIIPARTTGKGPTKEFLDDMNYKEGSGFAPHPLFPEWILQQMEKGSETLKLTRHVWYPALDPAPQENP